MKHLSSVQDRARIALLVSDRVLAAILDGLANKPAGGGPDLRIEAVRTAMAPDAHAFRQGDIDAMMGRYFQPVHATTGGKGAYKLEFLRDLGETYLFLDGNRFTVRPDRLLDYVALIAEIDPAFLIGAQLARLIDENEIPLSSLESIIEEQCPLALPRVYDDKPYADNHVHLGGVSSVPASLLSLATSRQTTKGWKIPGRFNIVFSPRYRDPIRVVTAAYTLLFRAIRQHCLSLTDPDPWAALAGDLHPLLAYEHIANPASGSLAALSHILPAPEGDIAKSLLFIASRRAAQQDLSGAFLTFATLLCWINRRGRQGTESLQLAVLGFIHLSHVLRSTIIMQGVGLDGFMEFFHSRIRKIYGSGFTPIMWLSGKGEQRTEVKVGGAEPSYLKELMTQAANGAPEWRLHPWQRLHFSLHFSRSEPQNGQPDRSVPRFDRHRKRVLTKAQEVHNHLCSTEVTTKHAMINGEPTLLEVSSLVRSFDVAGNENHIPIEVFAPALRWLRDKPRVMADGSQLAGRRQFSIHTGEDFSHLAGGLRHVDETVRFCGMGPGDRLGHALALGLDPRQWAERQGQAVVPLESHFDTIVWLWHYATLLSGRLTEAGDILSLLERRMQFYAEMHGLGQCKPEALYQAWMLRRNAAGNSSEERYAPDTRYWAPDFHASAAHRLSREAVDIYQSYLRRYDGHDIGTRTVMVHLLKERMPTVDEDGFGEREIKFVEALQDYLMTEYDRLGLTVEVCPSSNLHIGRINDCTEHPCLRWYPPQPSLLDRGAVFNKFGLRTGPVRICINTDDPGVFPTNIQTEYHLIQQAARERFGLSTYGTEKWIERLRQQGIEIFEQANAGVRRRVLKHPGASAGMSSCTDSLNAYKGPS